MRTQLYMKIMLSKVIKKLLKVPVSDQFLCNHPSERSGIASTAVHKAELAFLATACQPFFFGPHPHLGKYIHFQHD